MGGGAGQVHELSSMSAVWKTRSLTAAQQLALFSLFPMGIAFGVLSASPEFSLKDTDFEDARSCEEALGASQASAELSSAESSIWSGGKAMHLPGFGL